VAKAPLGGAPVASFFVVRTPLLPFDDLLSLSEGLRAPAALGDDAALAAALEEDRRNVRARLESLLARSEVQEALFLASPDLVGRLQQVGGLADADRVELAISRYVFRMCGRPTPFGLFAGLTVGSIGSETAIDLAPLAAYVRHARLDNDYVFALVDRLGRAPDLAATLRLLPNSSLYRVAGAFRYAESRLDGNVRTNHLVRVEATDYLEATLELAATGATAPQLAARLAGLDPEISMDEARSFVEQLLESQILVSDLAPAITGQEPLDDLLERLARYPAAAAERERLQECRSVLEALARAPLGFTRKTYVGLASRLDSLPAEVDPSRFLQVDLVKPAVAAVLGPEPLAEIARGVSLMWRLASSAKEPAIERFASAFYERYEGREVPLLEALDEDSGLEFSLTGKSSGAAAPLLEGLNFRQARDESPAWTRAHEFLLRKLVEVLADGGVEMTLDSPELEALQLPDPAPLPATFSVMATIGARSASSLARGEFDVVLGYAGGPSGANMLGRFCHAVPELCARVTEHVRSEERLVPHAVFAEIVHLPTGRIGNVLARPRLRDYEIPYLATSSASAELQIPVTDLTLALENRRLVLRSKRLGREVIPRLTSAHNYSSSELPIYRFLAALQNQDVTPGVRWDWGPLASSPFLPRVRSGRVILAPAVWRLSKSDASSLRAARGAARYRLIQEWRSARRIPRFVLVTQSDNHLHLDLDNVLAVDVLADMAGRGSGATLQEMIPDPECLVARGPEGRFVHEMIVPFVQPLPPPSRTPPGVRALAPLERSLLPGSEWLYAKLYTSESNADRVLRQAVAPLRREALERGVCDRWFFVRYVDPQNHLRVRFHGDPSRLTETLIPALHERLEPLLRDRTIWRLQIDTYEREIERYGGAEGMLLAERLFFVDSEAVLEIIELLSGDDGARARSRLALVGIDRLFDEFCLALPEKRAIVARLRDAMARDLGADKSLRISLADKFRAERRELERLLEGSAESEAERAGLEILARRSQRIAPIAADLRALAAAGGVTDELPALISSFAHMFINRLMRSQHQRQEYVLHDFLDRLHESRLARGRSDRLAPARLARATLT
jgi:thiopeptide-type bacteriocin biosynthesis protein